jgi:hypothetical protein
MHTGGRGGMGDGTVDQVISGALPEWCRSSGYSDGYGYGYGDGDDYGYGDGYGYGYGDGDGYGDGYGSDYGSGAVSKMYWQLAVQYFAQKWEPAQRERMLALFEEGAMIAFWGSDSNGLPSNGGGWIEPAAPGVVHTAPGPLDLCAKGTLHATLLPPKWRGERWWIVALIGEVIGDEEKYGALRREIIGEAI